MIIEGKKVAYITLGCKLNFSETSTIKHSLENAGTQTVGEKEGADIFVINTCSVTDVAEKKGRQLIRKIIHRNPGAYIIVVGCYAQLRAKELLEIEGVNLVLGAGDKFKVEDYLRHAEAQQQNEPHSCDIFKLSDFDLAYSFGDRTRCFLKIQDGCDYFCTYCTIPFARGKSRSATIRQITEAVKEVATKEIILTGVNTGDFGRGTEENFLKLLQTLEQIEEIDRFRISSIEPNLLTDDIIEFVAGSRRFMPHFHIPLQSGSNRKSPIYEVSCPTLLSVWIRLWECAERPSIISMMLQTSSKHSTFRNSTYFHTRNGPVQRLSKSPMWSIPRKSTGE